MNNKVWTLEDVKYVLSEISLKAGVSIEGISISISKRMTRCKGLCEYIIENGKYKTISFRFSDKFLDGRYPTAVVKQVIIHEYAHHYANTIYKKSQHHNATFKKVCRKLGISDSTYFENEVDFNELSLNCSDSSTSLKENKFNYKLTCSCCGREYYRTDIDRDMLFCEKIYRCAYCKSKVDIYCLNTLKENYKGNLNSEKRKSLN